MRNSGRRQPLSAPLISQPSNYFFTFCHSIVLGAGETVHLILYLSSKNESVSLDPQHHVQARCRNEVCNPSAGEWKGVGTCWGADPLTHWPTSLNESMNSIFSERSCLKKQGGEQLRKQSDMCVHAYTYMCKHTDPTEEESYRSIMLFLWLAYFTYQLSSKFIHVDVCARLPSSQGRVLPPSFAYLLLYCLSILLFVGIPPSSFPLSPLNYTLFIIHMVD